MIKIPVTIMRAGTSKGVFLNASDFPAGDIGQVDIIERLLGNDTYQMDGLGGGHVLSSKVAVISKSKVKDIDVDYKFVQVVPGRGVNDRISCGNMLAAVGPFAVENGYVKATDPITTVRVRDSNSGAIANLKLETPGEHVKYEGNVVLPGTAGSSAPILVSYTDLVKDKATMLPGGCASLDIDSVPVTLINVAIPLLIVTASSLGIHFPYQLRSLYSRTIIKTLLSLRAKTMESIGKPIDKINIVPKIALIDKPTEGGTLAVRYFTPHTPHRSLAVTGAITLAGAVSLPGTVAHDIAEAPQSKGDKYKFVFEHVAGDMELKMSFSDNNIPTEAVLVRTARLLMAGNAFVPVS